MTEQRALELKAAQNGCAAANVSAWARAIELKRRAVIKFKSSLKIVI